MTTLTIRRARPFERGDGNIELYIDSKVAGMLMGNKPLTVDVEPGERLVQASMFGARGAKKSFYVRQGEPAHIQVSGVKLKESFQWELPLFVLSCTIPADSLTGYAFWIKIAFMALWVFFLARKVRRRRHYFLKLEEATHPEVVTAGEVFTSEIPASSKRLSSLR